MINIDNLNFNYHKNKFNNVINDISFSIKKGEIVCLLGPSGCGKTSTLRLIAGLETPNSGSISIENVCVSDKNTFIEPHKRGVGFLFQDFALFPHLTAKENIAWGLCNKSEKDKKIRVKELLRQTSIIEHGDKYPHELSGGEQQRVSLARALAPRPRLLLLDEPFSSLDTNLRQDIREETSQILKDTNTTAIIVTHDPEEAMLIADKIILMHKGNIIQEGTAREIYENPKDYFVASFLGYVNQFDGLVKGDVIETIIGNITNRNFQNNTKLEIIVRPHALAISKISKTNKNNQYASIDSIKFRGSTSHILCKLENAGNLRKNIVVIQDDNGNLKKGDKVQFNINEESIFIFKQNK